MRIQTKRRPPTRRHLRETTDSSQSFDDDTASLQTPSNTVDSGQRTDIGNATHDNHSSLSTHVPVTHRTDGVDAPSSVRDAISNSQTHSDNSATVAASAAAAATISSAHSPSSATASVDNVISPAVPGDSSLPVGKMQVSKPSPDVDDIFADSSLFVSCKYVLCSYLYFLCSSLSCCESLAITTNKSN